MEIRPSFGQSGRSLVDKFGNWLSVNKISKTFNKLNYPDIIEFGCGYNAHNLVSLSRKSKKSKSFFAVDFSLSKKLKENSKFTCIESSINDSFSKLNNQKFDLILIISVLEHLENPVEVLKKCKNILKPNGKILINVPTWTGKFFLELSAFKLGLSPKMEMDDHKMYYSKKDLWPLLVKGGFKPSEITLRYHKFYLNLYAIVG